MNMKSIPADRVNKRNTNIRKFSDPIWRELRKLRFKPANPNPYYNELAAEEVRLRYEGNPDFDHDAQQFMALMLSQREAEVFYLYTYGGNKITQTDIAGALGVTQGTVANDLAKIIPMFKEFYYGSGGN